MSVSLSVAIINASFDPERRSMLIRLERALGGRVAYDTHTTRMDYIKDASKEGVLVTTKRAWMAARSSGATHHLVMQDDALPCRDFLEGAVRAIEAQPNAPVSFFDMSKAITDARAKGLSWAVRKSLSTALALAMPTKMAIDSYAWMDSHLYRGLGGSDERMSCYFLHHDIPVWYTVPSLVQHMDNGHSLLSHPLKLPNGRTRTSPYFIGEQASSKVVDFTLGLDKPHRGWSHSISEYEYLLKEA